MRPESIRWFERVYIGRIVIGIMLVAYSLYWAKHEGVYGPAIPNFRLLMIIGAVIAALFNVVLLFFIARRASRVAKWLFVVATILGLINVVRAVIAPNFLPPLLKMGPLFGVGLDFTMIMLLFQPDSRDWFERRGVVAEDYADTFS